MAGSAIMVVAYEVAWGHVLPPPGSWPSTHGGLPDSVRKASRERTDIVVLMRDNVSYRRRAIHLRNLHQMIRQRDRVIDAEIAGGT